MIGIILIVLLAILNGVFAMSEAAIIAVNRLRLQQRADAGSHQARQALDLAESPDRFLATAQIGITLIGILTGAFGSVTLSDDLSQILEPIPILGQYSTSLSVAIIVLFITYLSLVIGELVPKRIGLIYSEQIAMHIAGPMLGLAQATAPIVTLLSVSSTAILRLLRLREEDDQTATEADIQAILQQGAETGEFARTEPEMVAGVLSMDSTPVVSIMIPRTEIIWLDTEADIKQTILQNERTRFPVAQGDLDNFIGYVETKDLLKRALQKKPLDLLPSIREPIFIAEMAPILKALEAFKQSQKELGIVIDEFGGITGMITINDILEEIVGDLDQEDPQAIQRQNGSWLIDGLYPIQDFEQLFNVTVVDDAYFFQTLSGFVLSHLGYIPQVADQFEWEGLRIEVVDMDGKRVDKVLVNRL